VTRTVEVSVDEGTCVVEPAGSGDPEVGWLQQRLQPLVKRRFSNAED